ncbi:hypothetical protein RhiirA4_469719 [Rhizophagus irregularis]|uniref:Uncharacterized protein n=1 Tax=Rhizophagus irregularis TaxID=588596 RepID=A0A2I1H008_9GLOM|nr:hypothetical protein RhiirA4_469719 [Rhizophagus irregularis]
MSPGQTPFINYEHENDIINEIDDLEMNKVEENYTSSRLFTNKIHSFENLPEPRNATEEEQEAFHSSKLNINY